MSSFIIGIGVHISVKGSTGVLISGVGWNRVVPLYAEVCSFQRVGQIDFFLLCKLKITDTDLCTTIFSSSNY